MTESKTMKSYHTYKCSTENLRVGTYEVNELAGICGLKVEILIFLGALANAQETPIAIKDDWYIYSLDKRGLGGEIKYYLTIDNTIKYL